VVGLVCVFSVGAGGACFVSSHRQLGRGPGLLWCLGRGGLLAAAVGCVHFSPGEAREHGWGRGGGVVGGRRSFLAADYGWDPSCS